jgi:aspartokinase-like uncharacterized kinase
MSGIGLTAGPTGRARVVKVGGSLFDWPQLPQALTTWLDAQPPATNYLLAGGGQWVDALRRAANTFQLSETFCHEAAIDLMTSSAAVLRELLREYTGDFEVINARQFLCEAKVELPASWEVTSDSIAATIAEALKADELVLLKSTSASAQIVDSYFATAAANLPHVRIVNLRETQG